MIQVVSKVLYVMNDDVKLSLQGTAIVLKQEDVEKMRLPLNTIELIVIFGNTMISNHLVKACSTNNIAISYVDMHGNFLGRFYGQNRSNVFLRYKQYGLYDENKSVSLVKNIILAKSLNCANLLKYYSRFAKETVISEKLYEDALTIIEQSKKLKTADTIDEIRGLEGAIATIYFSNFDMMLKINDQEMKFVVRSKRPPENNINALLSFLYTLYTANITAALETFGLDSQLGYLHRMKSGRASLSCDMIEEFRGPIVDKFVIKVVNLSQIKSSDFEKTVDGIRMKKESQRRLLKLWEEYKEETIYHPFLKKNVKIKVLPYIQAQLLSQYIRGDIEDYPSFYYKLS